MNERTRRELLQTAAAALGASTIGQQVRGAGVPAPGALEGVEIRAVCDIVEPETCA